MSPHPLTLVESRGTSQHTLAHSLLQHNYSAALLVQHELTSLLLGFFREAFQRWFLHFVNVSKQWGPSYVRPAMLKYGDCWLSFQIPWYTRWSNATPTVCVPVLHNISMCVYVIHPKLIDEITRINWLGLTDSLILVGSLRLGLLHRINLIIWAWDGGYESVRCSVWLRLLAKFHLVRQDYPPLIPVIYVKMFVYST